MDATEQRHDNAASDADWATDISVLSALLETSTQRGDQETEPQWQQETLEEKTESNQLSDSDDDHNDGPLDAVEHVTVTALRRQVHLLQQEYDRYLEQRVAKSIVAAGGRSAPRAATIKLYRQYERLLRVAGALEAENERLGALLHDRQTQDQHEYQSRAPTPQASFSTPQNQEETERIPFSAQGMYVADAKVPATDRPPVREELPRSASE